MTHIPVRRVAKLTHVFWVLLTVVIVSVPSAGCTRDPQKLRDRYLASGDGYREQNRLPEAIIEYRNAVRQDQRSVEARLRLAEALTEAGDLSGARGEYVRVADLQPDNAEAQVDAGAFLLLAGDFPDAKDRVDRALRLNPHHVRGHVLLSGVLAGLKDFGGAVAALDQAIKLEPARGTTYATLGTVQMQRGQMEEAETALRRAVELEPASVPVRLALARFYWVNGRLTEAEKTFREAVDIDPSKTTGNQAIAAFYIATQRMGEAEPHLRAVVDATGAAEARVLLADYYAASNQEEKAVTVLNSLAGDKGTFAPAAIRLAALDHRAGRGSDAQRRLSEVLEREPANTSALLMSADLRLREGRVDEALDQTNAAIKTDARDPRAHIMLARVHAQRQDTQNAIAALMEALRLQPANALVQRELGRLYLVSGNIESAVRFSQEAVQADPSNVEGRLTLVRALIAERSFDRAGDELRKLESAPKQLTAVLVQRSILNALTNKPREARRGFERTLVLEPGNVEAFNGLTMLDLASRNFRSATARADKWVSNHPNDTMGLLAAARAYAGAREWSAAERGLRRVLEMDPSNQSAYSGLGQIYVVQRRLDEARAEFDALASKARRPAAALTMAGTILQMQERTGEARQRYQRALEADAGAAVAANNLAWIHAESGENLDTALQLAQTAMSAMPDAPEVMDTLGWVYYKKGLHQLAIPLFARCVDKDPAKAIYHYHLGAAYVKSGDSTRGRASLERALAAGPDAATAADIRRALAGEAPSSNAPR